MSVIIMPQTFGSSSDIFSLFLVHHNLTLITASEHGLFKTNHGSNFCFAYYNPMEDSAANIAHRWFC